MTFYPMGVGALFMTMFALDMFCRRPVRDMIARHRRDGDRSPASIWRGISWRRTRCRRRATLMLVGFFVTLFGGLPIGFALALAALIFIWVEGTLPGVIFAQQMARGIDNFVLLAIPFFILVGYLMEANGMSVRLIELLQRAVGRMRGGLNVVMVTSMVLFSGISGSKMADVAAVGSVLIPAARRSRQNPGSAVALLAASAVMAETIPPCINLIILGFVANLSIGGLFVAGLLPAGLMALALIAVSIIFGKRPASGRTSAEPQIADVGPVERRDRLVRPDRHDLRRLQERLRHRDRNLGLRRALCPRRRRRGVPRTQLRDRGAQFRAGRDPLGTGAVHRRRRAVAGLHADPAAGAACGRRHACCRCRAAHGIWLFMLLSIAVLIVMGSVLEGAAALIIFGPLLLPVAVKLGIDPLHFGVVLVIAMGIGLFAPPLGLGLYGACLIGKVPIEQTVKPIMGYLGLLLLCLLVIAFVPAHQHRAAARASAIDRRKESVIMKVLLTHTPQSAASITASAACTACRRWPRSSCTKATRRWMPRA